MRAVQGIVVACGLMVGMGALAVDSNQFTVTADIGSAVAITTIPNIGFGTIDPSAAQSKSATGICVYSNAAGAAYSVNLTSSTGDFTITDGTNSIAFVPTWNDGNGSGDVDLTSVGYGNPTPGFAGDPDVNCTDTGVVLNVTLDPATLAVAPASNYSATLTVTISAI